MGLIHDERVFGTALHKLEFRVFCSSNVVQKKLYGLRKPPRSLYVIHAFPRYQKIEPSVYIQQGELLLPQPEHVISNTPVAPLNDHTLLTQLAEAALSASDFRDQQWKMRTVAVAVDAANSMKTSSDKTLYLALAAVRKAALAHSYQAQSEWRVNNIYFPIFDHRSKSLFSDLIILKAREHVSLNTLAAALKHLDGFSPAWNGTISTLGELQNKQVALAHANVLRFQGRFHDAYTILEMLTPRNGRIGFQLGSVLCELGKYDEANGELNMLLDKARCRISIIRVRLALANAYLIKSMQAVSKGQGIDWRALHKSRDTYRDLRTYSFPATYFGKIDQLSISIGLAIADHLDGQVDSALTAWQVVSTTSQTFLSTGYTDMIFAYSTSELQLRRGATAQSDILRNYAKTLFGRTGRQHHFVGLGSYWLDIVDSWFVAQGREPISPA